MRASGNPTSANGENAGMELYGTEQVLSGISNGAIYATIALAIVMICIRPFNY